MSNSKIIKKFALDLTWVRHRIVGGTESYVNNLIQGFIDTELEFELLLVTSIDNKAMFEKYTVDKRISIVTVPIRSSTLLTRVIWQNIYLSKFLLKQQVKLCLEPVYSKPFINNSNISFITVIHDLEALHFPMNHSIIKNLWLRMSWLNSIKTSKHIICISDFVRDDILTRYSISSKKITTIFNPIIIDITNQCKFSLISEKYNVKKRNYFYAVAKMNPHKNLKTLIMVFKEIKERNIKEIPCKLLLSGEKGGMTKDLLEMIKKFSLEEHIILTGYVENSVRNALYANAKAFLFPSIFEGFGMPPVEAMSIGTPVITTKRACIPEITQNVANYVEDPYSVNEWIESMLNIQNKSNLFDSSKYLPKKIAEEYMEIIDFVGNGNKYD